MPDYLEEYQHRRVEKAQVKVETRKGMLASIPASSVHNQQLHGHSYHGRKVITPTMMNRSGSLDASSSSQPGANNKNSVHSMDASRRSVRSDASKKSETTMHSSHL